MLLLSQVSDPCDNQILPYQVWPQTQEHCHPFKHKFASTTWCQVAASHGCRAQLILPYSYQTVDKVLITLGFAINHDEVLTDGQKLSGHQRIGKAVSRSVSTVTALLNIALCT